MKGEAVVVALLQQRLLVEQVEMQQQPVGMVEQVLAMEEEVLMEMGPQMQKLEQLQEEVVEEEVKDLQLQRQAQMGG
jgi:hypothetical protein